MKLTRGHIRQMIRESLSTLTEQSDLDGRRQRSSSQPSVIEIPYHSDMRRARIILNQYGISHVAGVGIIEVSSIDESDAREALYNARIRHRQ